MEKNRVVEFYHDDITDFSHLSDEAFEKFFADETERCRLLNEGKLSFAQVEAMGRAQLAQLGGMPVDF